MKLLTFQLALLLLSIFTHHKIVFAEDFMGYPCTENCSGHEAGYEWAQENGIIDPDVCDGHSDSFIEGCQAYAEEQENSDSIDDEDSETEE